MENLQRFDKVENQLMQLEYIIDTTWSYVKITQCYDVVYKQERNFRTLADICVIDREDKAKETHIMLIQAFLKICHHVTRVAVKDKSLYIYIN